MGFAAKPLYWPVLSNLVVAPADLRSCASGPGHFFRRYRSCFSHIQQAEAARIYLEGQLSDLPRKTAEPIAIDHDVDRQRIQYFVGVGRWEDEAVRAELRRHVVEEIGDPEGILVLDPSSFPKKGTESVGVKRQWCGRLGKVENSQLGVFIGYVGLRSAALVDAELYLPREWTRNPERRKKCRVPKDVRFRTTAHIADERLKILSPQLPHAWVTGDAEFGRAAWLRRRLARRGERYILEVPANTRIRPLEGLLPKGRRKHPFQQVLAWAKAQPASSWTRVRVADGEKGPLEVDALSLPVQTKLRTRVGRRERLLVTRSVEATPEWKCRLSNADDSIPIETLVRVAAQRHRIEECFERAKGEAGLYHYEVRSWIGWHHHITMSLLALWYLTLTQRRLGEKNTRRHGPARGRNRAAAAPA